MLFKYLGCMFLHTEINTHRHCFSVLICFSKIVFGIVVNKTATPKSVNYVHAQQGKANNRMGGSEVNS